MYALGYQLVNKVQVILESVLRLLWVGNVAAVAYNSFADTAGLLSSIYTEPQLHRTLVAYINDLRARQTLSE